MPVRRLGAGHGNEWRVDLADQYLRIDGLAVDDPRCDRRNCAIPYSAGISHAIAMLDRALEF